MLLTIAIPHSHDIDSLKSTLECLKSQQHRDVEILVNDNALGQEFRDVMADMSQELGNLVYYENTKFQTYDQNVDNCVWQSKGDFVWLLGVGDTIPKGHIELAIELIKKHPRAFNILANVHVNGEDNLNKIDACQSFASPMIYQSMVGNFPLDSVYNSALSGNLVNRLSWLMATKTSLRFENWGHVERTLQVYSDGGINGFGIRSQELSVVVERPKQAWWNQDDVTFLYNLLTHAQILSHYGSLPYLANFKRANLLKNATLYLIKARWYSKTIEKKGPSDLHQKVNSHIRSYPIAWLFFMATDLIPRRFMASGYLLARRLKNLLR